MSCIIQRLQECAKHYILVLVKRSLLKKKLRIEQVPDVGDFRRPDFSKTKQTCEAHEVQFSTTEFTHKSNEYCKVQNLKIIPCGDKKRGPLLRSCNSVILSKAFYLYFKMKLTTSTNSFKTVRRGVSFILVLVDMGSVSEAGGGQRKKRKFS